MTDEDILSRLLYRDGLILVIDKPAGVPVHRDKRGGDNLENYFAALRFGLPRNPALAHRLDRDTSGCLILGRHRRALELLGQLFRNGQIEKTYWAVVEGAPGGNEGEIDLALALMEPGRGWRMRPDSSGLPARTCWRVLGRGRDAEGRDLAFLELTPLTGRTHQLRVHCQASGFPILGDPVYGRGPRPSAPLHLHARSVRVPLEENAKIDVAAPAPAHMREALRLCGWEEPGETG